MEFSTIVFFSSIPWLSLISLLFTQGAYAQFTDIPNQQLKSAQISFAKDISTLLTEGDRLLEMKDFAGAIAHYERALAIAEKNQSREHQALILAALGRVYDLNGKYLKAEKTFKAGIVISESTGSRNLSLEMRQSQIYLYTGLGITYQNIGKYEQAIAQLKLAVNLSQQLPKALWGGDFIPWQFTHFEPRFYLASAYRANRQYPQAISLFQECHTIAVREGDREKQAISLVALGQTHATLGDLVLARRYFQQVKALGTFPNNPDLGRAIDTLDVLSGELADAAESFTLILPVLERVGRGLRRIEEVTANLPSFAYVGRTANQLESTHDKLLQIIPQLRQGDIFSSIPIMFKTIDELVSLLKYLEKGNDGTKIIGFDDSSCNIDEVRAAINQGKYERGNLSPEAIGVILDVADDLCKINQSLDGYNQRQRKQNQKFDPNSEPFDMEAIIHKLEAVNRRSTAKPSSINLEIAQRQVAIAKSSGSPLDYGKALNFLGDTYASQKAYPQAEESLMAAIAIWEGLRVGLEDKEDYRVALFETQNETYKSLQKVRIAMGKYPQALEAAEQGRARAFLALLSSKFSSDRLEQYSEPQVTIAQLQQIAREQQITIVSYSLISSNSVEFLRDSAAISQLYVWAISPQGQISWRDLNLRQWEIVKQQKPLRIVIENLQERLSNKSGTVRLNPEQPSFSLPRRPVAVTSDRDAVDELKQLHELLIAPIADLLPTDANAKVVFVPDQALFLIPFAALQNKSGKYLIEDYPIAYTPSIQSLAYTKKLESLPKATGNLIVGNPSEDLADAAIEAAAIAKLLNTQALTGKAATKNKVLAQIENSQIIHLAMHGKFDDNNGLDSALNFGSQVFLSAKEILNLSLKAHLVILSACNTGKGAIKGDGVIGLSRAFILAGTPRIIVSLWSVPDGATSQLMMDFYQNMLDNKSNNQGYAHALRQSMLKTMQNHPHPRNWAAFGLIGAVD